MHPILRGSIRTPVSLFLATWTVGLSPAAALAQDVGRALQQGDQATAVKSVAEETDPAGATKLSPRVNPLLFPAALSKEPTGNVWLANDLPELQQEGDSRMNIGWVLVGVAVLILIVAVLQAGEVSEAQELAPQ
jgi:hypothetical protein